MRETCLTCFNCAIHERKVTLTYTFMQICTHLLRPANVHRVCLAITLLICGQLAAQATGKTPDKAPAKPPPPNPDRLWTTSVEPLLDKYCLKCHAGVRQRGGLDLRSLETMLRGGDGGPAILPGKPDESHILQYVQPKAALHMPPDANRQLTPTEIGALRSWIAALPPANSKVPDAAAARSAWVKEYLALYRSSRPMRDVLPARITGSAAIDWFLKTDWQRDKITPSASCSDALFVRRVSLDLVGRVPSSDEVKQFLSDPPAERRNRLVGRLLESPDYARHMREVFDPVLMGVTEPKPARRNRGAPRRDGSGWFEFLEDSFAANRPWNVMVRDMLVARSAAGPERGADWFLAQRNNSYQAIAEAVAPVVFGVKIGCAQCHNHPLVWEIEQKHYWGLVAAFDRSKNVETDMGTAVSESAVGGFIKFANLKKESQPAELVFLNGKSIPERVPGPDEKEADSPDLYVVPPKDGARVAAVPKFSRREAFADLTTRDNPMLARAFVNRMWAELMGRGIVHPVDEIDSRHPPSHPELLEWLTHDFEQSGYDVKRLIKNIVLSSAYQLDSRPAGKTPPTPDSFARAVEKPLSAEQLLHSLLIVTGTKPDSDSAVQLERSFDAKFPRVLPDIYNPTLQQALFLSNSPLLEELLKPAPGNSTSRIAALGSADARVGEAFVTVLGRSPDSTELQACRAMLQSQPPERGVKSLLWALLTCAEFQVNH